MNSMVSNSVKNVSRRAFVSAGAAALFLPWRSCNGYAAKPKAIPCRHGMTGLQRTWSLLS